MNELHGVCGFIDLSNYFGGCRNGLSSPAVIQAHTVVVVLFPPRKWKKNEKQKHPTKKQPNPKPKFFLAKGKMYVMCQSLETNPTSSLARRKQHRILVHIYWIYIFLCFFHLFSESQVSQALGEVSIMKN